jgi:benzoyl-CoA reductase/2-hydroxyglutaryl-CoA dehydratase subunit BcrC/BadD/HgdB
VKADPQPVSLVEVGLARLLVTGSPSRKVMVDEPNAIATLNQEIKERINEDIGVVEKGAPRIMIFITPMSDPSIMHMIENAGLALPVMLLTAPLRLEPWQTTYTTLGEKQAEAEMKVGIYHSSYAVAKRWAEVVEDLNLDGAIWGYQFNCRPLAQPSHLLPKFVQETTGVPVLSLEMDYFDSRTYSAGALRTRVETFAEMLRARRASAWV